MMSLATQGKNLGVNSKPPQRHRMRWWMTKVVFGCALIAALIFKTIYVISSYWKFPIVLAQAFCVVGFFLVIYHYLLLKKDNNNIESPKHLVTNKGLYRWLRHPMYLADFIWFFGIFMLFANPVTLLLLVIAYGALWLHIQEEERHLAYLFEDDFEQWRLKTNLLIPYLY